MTDQEKQVTSTAVATKSADPKPTIRAGGAVSGLVPQSVEEAFRLSEALARAGDMIPKQFQGQPMQIMAAIAKGAEVGLAPMQALASIAVINGRPTIWGDAIPALVQRAGHHIDVDYVGDGDSLCAVATLTRGDTGKVYVRRFSVADAKRAGLWGKAGPWSNYGQRMLGHRARTWAARDGAADALMGLQVNEEVQDYGPDAARDITPGDRHRRGGMAYRALPEVDDIIEPDTTPSESDRAAAMAEAQQAADLAAREGAAE
jgi:hypothetical protein